MLTEPSPQMDTFSVDSNGIVKLLQDIDPYKAQGPDNIPTRFLKEAAQEIVQPLP